MSWNDDVIEQFRAGQDVILDTCAKESLALLHTTGAKTGEHRISPVACFREDGRLVVVASSAGRPQHPAWYHNLVANPEVTAPGPLARPGRRAAVCSCVQ